MSTEEKMTSTPETAEPPKPKRRFKLDKKHIQGFIAGIILCTITFTGLYYGTGGRYFSGDMSYTLPLVTDANFENEVLKSDRIVLVVTFTGYGIIQDSRKEESIDRQNIYSAWRLTYLYGDKVKAFYLDTNNSSETIRAYNIWKGPRILVFRDGKCVLENYDFMYVTKWVEKKCR